MLEDVTNQTMQVDIHVSAPEQRSEIGGVNKYFAYTVRGKDAKGTPHFTQETLRWSGGTQTSSCFAK